MIRALCKRLRRDTNGVTAIEFGLIAPVLLVSMLGVFDLGYNMYTNAVLNGAIQKAARDSTIEGAQSREATLDAKVTKMVQVIAPGATTSFDRSSYTTFSDVNQPEDFDDVNGNGACDNGEPFEDANGNGSWDANRGATGFGGARDAVMYEVTVVYPRAFPVANLLGQSNDMTLVVRTVLRNQPFGPQQSRTSTGNCA